MDSSIADDASSVRAIYRRDVGPSSFKRTPVPRKSPVTVDQTCSKRYGSGASSPEKSDPDDETYEPPGQCTSPEVLKYYIVWEFHMVDFLSNG